MQLLFPFYNILLINARTLKLTNQGALCTQCHNNRYTGHSYIIVKVRIIAVISVELLTFFGLTYRGRGRLEQCRQTVP